MGGRLAAERSAGTGRPGVVLDAPARLAAVQRARLQLGDPGGWPDALAALLARATGAPIALVNVVDGEQEVSLGAFGMTDPAPRPVCDSLCEAVIRGGVPAIANDAALDRRFADKRPVRDGRIRSYAGFPVRDAHGELVGVVAIVDHRGPRSWSAADLASIDGAAQIVAAAVSDDAAQRHLAGVRDAERHRAFLDAVLESLHTGVAASGPDGELVLLNAAMRDALEGEFQVFWPDGRPVQHHEHPLFRALRGETVPDADYLVRRPDREPRTFMVNARPILGPDSEHLGAVSAAHDVTERRRAEELALELAHTKDEYIALVGHEMRTPLTSIAAFTELIGDAPDDTPLREVRDLLGVVERNTALLRGVIEDLLDLAALDAGHAALRPQPMDISALVRESASAQCPTAAQLGVRLHVEGPDSCVIEGDPTRLRQVVDNVINNAVKYSPCGGPVTVTVSHHGDAVEVVVADEGIGIPDDERPHVFRRFFRSTRARDRSIPGTGLGLAITQVIVQQHGGTIALAPQEGPGTTVVLRLPVGAPAPEPELSAAE